ncbi:MAG: hypothetical protein M3P43_00250 [Actinomycetota bacterium]|nr:hypothetical protein [Actinomycetota bacterium]
MAEAGISLEEKLAQAAVELSSQSILELVAKSGSDAGALRGGLDILLRARSLASTDPISEHLAVTMLRAGADHLRILEDERSRPSE